jgi:hypothetical protein
MNSTILLIQSILFVVAVAIVFVMPEKKGSKAKKSKPVTEPVAPRSDLESSRSIALKRLKDMQKQDKREFNAQKRASQFTNQKLKSVLDAYNSWMYSEDHPTYKFIATM